MGFRPRYIVLVLSIVIMLSGVALAASVQSGFGSVVVTEVDFQDDIGSTVHSTLQTPTYATSADPLPGVVMIHGSLQNKEWVMAFGIELARRGFVVLTIDASGHGNSEPGNNTGKAALEYLAGLDYVDETAMGIIGHSMGGGFSWWAIRESSIIVKSLVLVGAGFTNVSTVPYVPNTLVAVGYFDSLSRYSGNPSLLDDEFGVTGVEAGVTYGNFTDNTARKLAVAPTNHLFETMDPVIVIESVEWMKDSLKGMEDAYWIPSDSLVYPFWLLGGLMSLIGIILTIFPVVAIIINLPIFAKLKEEPTEYAADSGTFWKLGTIYGAIGLVTFFPFLLVGGILDGLLSFPQGRGLSVMGWMVGSALVAALVLFLYLRRKDNIPDWRGLWGLDSEIKKIPSFAKTLVLGLIIFIWLYAWTLLVDLGFALDIRVFLPGFNDLTFVEALIMPIYFIGFLIYFLVDGIWLMGVMRPAPKDSWMNTQVSWSLKAVFIKCIPYLIMIVIEFGGGLIVGAAVVPGIIGYSWLFFYAFAPWFAICAVVMVFCYRMTGKPWLAAIINALMCAWLLATILAI
jgi:pimeloyl-ACP methyl ester carboxylesterase